MGIDTVIREIIREELKEWIASAPTPDPVLISVADSAKICRCDPSTIRSLIKEKDQNGFPAVIIGPRSIWVDKRRLSLWLEKGGLSEKI